MSASSFFTDFFRTLFAVQFSDEEVRKEQERAAFIHFMDFVEECGGENLFVRVRRKAKFWQALCPLLVQTVRTNRGPLAWTGQ